MNERKNKIQENVKQLEEIIKYFESEDIDLDEAIEKYEKAAKLVQSVNEVLKEYELRIEKVKKSE
jgi:exodeoxyribonuclease VII small subunit